MKNITLKSAILGMTMLFGATTVYAEEMKSDAMPMKSEPMMAGSMKSEPMMKSEKKMKVDKKMKQAKMMKKEKM